MTCPPYCECELCEEYRPAYCACCGVPSDDLVWTGDGSFCGDCPNGFDCHEHD